MEKRTRGKDQGAIEEAGRSKMAWIFKDHVKFDGVIKLGGISKYLDLRRM